jgi:hypothetical protein
MTAVVSAELFKLRTTRGPWLIVTGLGLVAAAMLALNAALLGAPGQPALLPSVLGDLARAPGRLTGAAALLLGLLLSTAEYRHATILTTRLGHPRPVGLVVGKAAAAAVAAAALAVAVELLMVVGGAAVLAGRDTGVEVLHHGIPAAVGIVALVAGLHAVAGVGIGELLRNPALAVGVVFGWALLVEGVLPVLLRSPGLGRWLPSGATESALTLGWTGQSPPLPAWTGLGLLAAYAIALIAAGLGRSTVSDP